MRRVKGNVSECSQKKGGSEVNVDSEPQRCGWYCLCVGVVNGGVAGVVCAFVSQKKEGGSEVNVDSELQRCGWYCCVGGVLNGGVVIHRVVAGVVCSFVLQKKGGSEVNVWLMMTHIKPSVEKFLQNVCSFFCTQVGIVRSFRKKKEAVK
jgi:hypothetical protein